MCGREAGDFYTLLALVNAGDEVVYPDPGFPIFESMRRRSGSHSGRPYDPGRGGRRRPDLAALSEAITERTRLVVLNSPGNPTGVVHRPDEIAEIARLCQERDLAVLSDEIYSKILYEGEHRSIAAEPGPAAKTVIVDGFSKTWCMTGWRLGYAVAPRALVPHYGRLVTNSVSCAVSFVQRAAFAALTVSSSIVADVRGTGLGARALADGLLEEAGGEGALRFSFTAEVDRIREAVERIRKLLAD